MDIMWIAYICIYTYEKGEDLVLSFFLYKFRLGNVAQGPMDHR